MGLIAIGAALCILIAAFCVLHRAWRLIEEQTKAGFQRPDIADIGELRTRLAMVEKQQDASGRIAAGMAARLDSVETTVRQAMHSGQVPALDDVGWSPTQTEGLIRD